ncbi:Lzipper-MIP1 domain-containing protein [Cephalotus follicularis]|uniref:Lzipper-MIP1 domain-containing protein n=1 Tax=Cephalotus follicularis TaxID=3775 RepID=A0A1Q3BCS9_CEPFO|nr:Lzipper-MIP1 domain-containing protein [Cephalotus follicularis]
MVGLNCRSSSSSFPSSPLHSAPSALDNGLLQNILNLTPRLSSHNNPEGPVAVMTTVPFLCSLETTFPDQASLCWDLEKTVNCRSIISNGTQAPKSSAELRKEIARIEVEILHLEHYLLSLYRTAFKGHVSTLSNNTSTELQDKAGLSSLHVANQSHYRLEPHVPRDGFVHHDKTSPAHNWEISDIQSCTASLKATSTRDHRNSDSGHCSLADILGASHIDRSLHTPDRLSEDIVKCICSIYCKLANGPNNHAGLAVSPTSSNSLSSSSIFSSKNPCDTLSSGAYSDPVLKVYTAKSIFKDLKLAKEEFIQASVYIHKETKIFLPKILQYFVKVMSLGVPGLLEDISGCLLKVQQKAIRKCMKGRYDRVTASANLSGQMQIFESIGKMPINHYAA